MLLIRLLEGVKNPLTSRKASAWMYSGRVGDSIIGRSRGKVGCSSGRRSCGVDALACRFSSRATASFSTRAMISVRLSIESPYRSILSRCGRGFAHRLYLTIVLKNVLKRWGFHPDIRFSTDLLCRERDDVVIHRA